MTYAQKPDFVFWRNGRVHLNRRGRQFSRLLAAKVCASAVVMLDTPCSGVVWRVLATHSTRQFPLLFPSRASPCAIIFQLESTTTTFVLNMGVRICNSKGPHPLLWAGSRAPRGRYKEKWYTCLLEYCVIFILRAWEFVEKIKTNFIFNNFLLKLP